MAIFRTARSEHVRLNVIPLLAALSKWQSITCLIHCLAHAVDGAVASLARTHIREWNRHYNRSQIAPSRREVEDLDAALATAGKALDREIAEEIRFALRLLR